MIRQVRSGYDPAKLEKEIQAYWVESRAYERTKELRSRDPDYFFVDGPPYTTGHIHLGTAMNKTLKDTYIRFRRMQGNNVRDQPGYDMHGLPIEVKVEQTIGVRSKKGIEEYGIDKFVSTCKSFALDLQRAMTEQFKELGVWMDWERPYMTLVPEYIEAAWWTLKRAYDRDMLESSNRVLPWCPRCETALAEAEIEYWEEDDPSIFVRFPLRDQEGVSLLIWTTTPWTLPANRAVMVHPDFEYAKVDLIREGKRVETVIMLEAQVEKVAGDAGYDEYEIVELMAGDHLVGLEYEPPFEQPHCSDGKWTHRVIPADVVEADNTGLVHTAPGHGPDDFEIGARFGIGPYCPVDEGGRFTDQAGKWAGMKVRKANAEIVADLEERGRMFLSATVKHRYGHCWRCRSPIIYRNTDQWFLRVTEVKDLMLKEVDRVRWNPEWAGSSRERNWVEGARDWCISRQRYWGIPIPVWRCECGETRVVGRFDELEEGEGWREDMEPHRPWIDQVTFTCPRCGGRMTRVPDVLDVWFDSGVTSWAQLGYPSDKEEFDRWWPTRWITEAHDQTRGWFYSQLAAGCIAFDRSPYDEVLMHGWVLDPKGQPMSKSKGNVIEPVKVIEEQGADALRFYMMRANAPWEDMAFQHEGPRNARKMLNILWNVVNFATTYMSLDSFDPASVQLDRIRSTLRAEDRWILSRTERLKREVTEELERMNVHKACRALETYITDDLSRWYVRLIRDRMWKEEGDLDKLAAYKVLYEAIMGAVRLLAPFCPHITEEIYRNMDGSLTSVHMLDWPVADMTLIDDRIESGMEMVQEIVEIVSAERQKKGVKLRWPLKRIAVKGKERDVNEALRTFGSVLTQQTNVKQFEFVPYGEEWEDMILSVIPNPHAIGKVYRQWSSKIAVLLKSRPAKQVKENVEKGEYSLGIEGQFVKIEPNMVSFAYAVPPEVVPVEFSAGELYLDFERTPELEAEGFTRELIRRIQQMRKEMKLDVEEFVNVQVAASAMLTEYFKVWRGHIMKEVRARELEFVNEASGDRLAEWEVNGERLRIGITSLRLVSSMRAFASLDFLSEGAVLALVEAGHDSPESLAGMTKEDLAAVPGLGEEEVEGILRCLSEPERPAEGPGLPREEMMSLLLEVPNMTPVIAEMIYDAGLDSPESIRAASDDELRRANLGSRTIEDLRRHLSDEGGAEPEPQRTEGDAQLEGSFTYLIKEERSERAYELLQGCLAEGERGFCVTRNYPLKVRSKYKLGETPILWLSNIGKENSIRPKDLEKLSMALENFLAEEGGVVLLEGIEYLVTNNSFLTVLRFLQSLRDQVAVSRAVLLISVNPSTLEENEVNLLEKEVDLTI